MVEVEVREHSPVAAHDATAAVLLDQELLDLPVPSRHGLTDAAFAPVPVLPGIALVEVMDLHPVPRALLDDRRSARLRRSTFAGIRVLTRHEHMFASAADACTRETMRPRRLELRSSDLKG